MASSFSAIVTTSERLSRYYFFAEAFIKLGKAEWLQLTGLDDWKQVDHPRASFRDTGLSRESREPFANELGFRGARSRIRKFVKLLVGFLVILDVRRPN
jgi:hypothetical protein